MHRHGSIAFLKGPFYKVIMPILRCKEGLFAMLNCPFQKEML